MNDDFYEVQPGRTPEEVNSRIPLKILLSDWEKVIDADHLEILEESLRRFINNGEIFFPYKKSTHQHHLTTVTIFNEQLHKIRQYYHAFYKWREFRRIRELADKWMIRRLHDYKQRYEDLAELGSHIQTIAESDFHKRKKQEEIIALARSFGVDCYWDDDHGPQIGCNIPRSADTFRKVREQWENGLRERFRYRQIGEQLPSPANTIELRSSAGERSG